MLNVQYKRTSAAIDDEDLEAVAAAVRAHALRAINNQRTDADMEYYLLLAKMLFRIAELKMQDGFAQGVEAAANWVDQRQHDYEAANGSIDPDTGALEFGRGAHARAKEEYVGELAEIAEGIRALAATPSAPSMRTDPRNVCANAEVQR